MTLKLLPSLTPVLFLALLVGMVATGLMKGFDHDEHQFIVPALLALTEGAQPYRDYPLLHVPGQVLIFDALFAFGGNPLLIARLFNTIAAFATLLMIYSWACRQPTDRAPAASRVVALSCVALWTFNPSFPYGFAASWNIASSTGFAVASFLLVICGTERDSKWLIGLAGACFGAAVGTRLSWAPLGLPFILGLLFLNPSPMESRNRFLRLGAFGAGMTLVLLPVAAMALRSPDAFWFGNFEYPFVSRQFHMADRSPGRVMAMRKVYSMLRFTLIRPVPLLTSAALVGLITLCGREWVRGARKGWEKPAFALLVLAFVVASVYAPAQLNKQYYYMVFAFAVLAIVACVHFLAYHGYALRTLAQGLGVCALIAVIYGLQDYHDPRTLFRPRGWTSTRFQNLGEQIYRHSGKGRVLTLAPLFPLLGGSPIYREFALGPFPWRVARFVKPERRQALKVIGPDDLAQRLENDMPAAVLVGVERLELEQPLIDYATGHGYRPVRLRGTAVLWLGPHSSRQPDPTMASTLATSEPPSPPHRQLR
jgi:hypothetical protein